MNLRTVSGVRVSSRAPAKQRVVPPDPVRAGIQVLLDSLSHLPAFVFNGRLDIKATNDLGRALYSPVFDEEKAGGRDQCAEK